MHISQVRLLHGLSSCRIRVLAARELQGLSLALILSAFVGSSPWPSSPSSTRSGSFLGGNRWLQGHQLALRVRKVLVSLSSSNKGNLRRIRAVMLWLDAVLGLGREEHHIPILTCGRQVSTVIFANLCSVAPVYAAASATRQVFFDAKYLHISRRFLVNSMLAEKAA